MNLQEVLAAVEGLSPEKRADLATITASQLGRRKFIPSPGPQTDAWFSKADVLLYGGEGGGGKTGLLCGLALSEHQNSLLMRRHYTDHFGVGGIIDEIKRLNANDGSFNGSAPATLRPSDGRVVTFGGAANIGDEQNFQGRARDFLGVDEAAQFAESQIRFLMGWVRSTREGQRCRTVLASNAPIDNTGDWLINMFRPWLDPTHPNPAAQGELRWYVTVRKESNPFETEDIEVDGPDPVEIGGEVFEPSSRTFIRARLKDNPFLGKEYQKTLDGLPEPYRSAVRDGNFMAAKKDNAFQVIPTQWIREAQARWTPNPPEHAPMSALAADVAQGGPDNTILAARYDGWFAPLKAVPGTETPTGNEVAGLIIAERRNAATVIIDMGGGYGGATYLRLRDNQIEPVIGHKGAEKSIRRTTDQQFGFYNKRAEIAWRFREALDPAQDGGSSIALPDDPELVSDLTSLEFEVTSQGIKVTPKDKLVDMLGRSPDRGDAVMMANAYGPKLMTHGNEWRKFRTSSAGGVKTVNMSRMSARRMRP